MVALHLLGSTLPLMVLATALMPFAGKLGGGKACWVLSMASSLFAALTATAVFAAAGDGPLVYTYGGWPPHIGVNYAVDSLGALMGLFIAWGMVAVVVYSLWYRKSLSDPARFYALLTGLEVGMLACVYTGDVFNLFVMLEVLSISAYGLVAYHRERAEAVEGAVKYALIGSLATSFYFAAVLVLYATYGSLNAAVIASLARSPRGAGYVYASALALALALWVFTFKSALFPNHFWLPDALTGAPPPVAAVLSGLSDSVGVYAVLRFLYTIFGPDSAVGGEFRSAVLAAFFILGSIGGVVGALMAMAQTDLRRLLAYSAVSHVGLVYVGLSAGFLGIGADVKLAVAGALAHAVSHGVSSVLLFMAAGVFADDARTHSLDGMRGVAKRHPVALAAFALGLFNLVGLMPFLGFYSKLAIALGCAQAGLITGPIIVVAVSALSLPAYLKALYAVAFAAEVEVGARRSSWVEAVPFILALSLLVSGSLFPWVRVVFEETARAVATSEGVRSYMEGVLRFIPAELLGGGP